MMFIFNKVLWVISQLYVTADFRKSFVSSKILKISVTVPMGPSYILTFSYPYCRLFCMDNRPCLEAKNEHSVLV